MQLQPRQQNPLPWVLPWVCLGCIGVLSCGSDTSWISSNHPTQKKIIGGSLSGSSDYPAVGVLLTKGTVMGSPWGSMVCTGTLIAPDVVLTAGHCTNINEFVYMGFGEDIENHFSFQLDVVGFGNSLQLPADAVQIREFVPHPNWDYEALNQFTGGLTDFHDIALAILQTPVYSRQPSVVMEPDDSNSMLLNSSVEIVGYGQTNPDNPNSVGQKFQATSKINELGITEMQIGDYPQTTPQKCHGDSGGPSYLDISDGKQPRQRLIGVTSHAYDDTDCHRGGVDTRVDVYRAWIEATMVSTCSDGTRSACSGNAGLTRPSSGLNDAAVTDASTTLRDASGQDRASIGPDRYSPWDTAYTTDRIGTSYLPRDTSQDQGCQCNPGADAGTTTPFWILLLGLSRRRRM